MVPITYVLVAVLIAFAVWRLRRAERSAVWAGGILLSILASPLGWVHYLPLAVGPLLAVRMDRRWLLMGLACLAVPIRVLYTFHFNPLGSVTLGSIYVWGALAVLVGVWPRVQRYTETP